MDEDTGHTLADQQFCFAAWEAAYIYIPKFEVSKLLV
jgi:hypothetical protein